MLLGKYAARPSIPFLSALAMLGYGLAGAVSPYLGVVLRNQDARLPFVISSVVLLVTALALSGVERSLAQEPKINHQHQQRRNFKRRLRQRHAEEICVVHCAPPASSAFTAGSIVSSSILG